MQKIIVTTLFLTLLTSFYYNYNSITQLNLFQNQDNEIYEYDNFVIWTKKFKKVYSSEYELMYRFEVYKKNMKLIKQYNDSHEGVEFGENQYCDLEYQEFKTLMNSGHSKHSHSSLRKSAGSEKIKYLNITDLAQSVDWRGKALPGIKDQGTCGACWAFSAVGALEGAYAVKNKEVISFSEQQVVDCCRLSLYGCNGGDPIIAFDQCLLREGIMRSSDYQYTGVFNKRCLSDDDLIVYHPTDYAIVPQNDTEQLLMAISQQPVSICVSESPVFQFYSKGILNTQTCGLYLDHCIVAAGINYIFAKFIIQGYGTENGIDYWLLRNSWSESWGEKGYIRIKRDVGISPGICGVAMEGSYVIV